MKLPIILFGAMLLASCTGKVEMKDIYGEYRLTNSRDSYLTIYPGGSFRRAYPTEQGLKQASGHVSIRVDEGCTYASFDNWKGDGKSFFEGCTVRGLSGTISITVSEDDGIYYRKIR